MLSNITEAIIKAQNHPGCPRQYVNKHITYGIDDSEGPVGLAVESGQRRWVTVC